VEALKFYGLEDRNRISRIIEGKYLILLSNKFEEDLV